MSALSRRQFVQGVGVAGTSLLVSCGRPSFATDPRPAVPAKVARIGYLELTASPAVDAFRDAMRAAGYVEGQTIAVEYRFAEGNMDQLQDQATALVRLNVDLIVAVGAAVRLAVSATSTIPVVMVGVTDPIGLQFVDSLARPKANVTGTSQVAAKLSSKRVELLKQTSPAASRIGVLGSASPATRPQKALGNS